MAILLTLGRLIGHALISAGSRYEIVGTPGVITGIRPHINVRIPDLGIAGTADAPGQRALPDPVVLIELLSPCNASDTWDNVWAYTTIPSVREIVVVHSTGVLADVLRRHSDGQWPTEADKITRNGSLRLDSIGFACDLPEMYAQTHLA